MPKRIALGARATLASTLALSGLAVIGSSTPAGADVDPDCSTITTVLSDTFCTLADGATFTFTVKGGNGGDGGNGGPGGNGGSGYDGDVDVPGGEGGGGGQGGAGAIGAKVSGTYTNTSGHAVTVSLFPATNGGDGAAGDFGDDGANAPHSGPGNGGNGTDGGDGGMGGNGGHSTILVDSTNLIVAEGGTGGEGGLGGQHGTGGNLGGVPGDTGANGADGENGFDGSTDPSPLPDGWTALETGNEAPFIQISATGGNTTPPPPTPNRFLPLTPQRLLDTRTSTKLVGGAAGREITVAGQAGVPADATAVVLNVTSANSMGDGYVSLYPCGQTMPVTSTVNFTTGQIVANAATVPVASGKICAYSNVDTDVILDVNGAYSTTAGTAYLGSTTPVRLLDTRDNSGTKVQPGTPKAIVVAGQNGIAGDSTAVVLNVTVTAPEADGYVTLYPCGSTAPLTSNVNFVAGQTVPNQVTVSIGTASSVCASSSVATHLVVDADASFGPTGIAAYETVTPARLLDTRQGAHLMANTPLEVTFNGRAGISADATAVIMNVTASNATAGGYITVAPCGTTVSVSNLNVVAGQTVANAVTTGLNAGKACVTSTVDTDLILDVFGDFVNIPG